MIADIPVKTKKLVFECTEEMLKDMKQIHGFDLYERIKQKILELEDEWIINPYKDDKENDDGTRFHFRMKPEIRGENIDITIRKTAIKIGEALW
jgi:hypothetical protein